MSEKLKALTDKIYQEGIEKAKSDSDRIVAEAKTEAKKIVEEAEKERQKMIRSTEEEMASYRKKVEAEIKLAAQKSANKIKQSLRQLITEKVIQKPIENSLSDSETTLKILSACVTSLSKDEGSWIITLSEKDEKFVKEAIAAGKVNTLASGVTVKPDPSLKNGFEIKPEEANYSLYFNDETFIDFLGQFLKIETKSLL